MKRRWNIFMACARMGYVNLMRDKILIVGSFLIYATIMALYAGVLHQIADADLAAFGLSQAQLIWYLGTTEFILFTSSNTSFKEVQNAFQTGEAHLGLLRPAAQGLVRFGFWSGESLGRILVLFPVYFVFLGWLAEAFVMSPWQVLGVILSIPMASLIMNCALYIVGASCLWFVQSEPAFWIWQKAIFLLGAMLWPLMFYPDWAQKVIWLLPFHGILAHGGNWALDLPAQTYLYGFVNQIVWSLFFLWLLRRFDRIILRRVQSGEGG